MGWFTFSLTILLGAYLMFQIQPLIGKIVTPRFGGTASVWCLCVLFFQLALLGGYTLTYFLSKLPLQMQGVAYISLMLVSLLFTNIPIGPEWTPDNPEAPITSLLTLLLIYLAVPCILLSTVSGLMQNWYNLAGFGDPYHLYSISNVGSLGALLLYPVVIEPNLTVGFSVQLWTQAYWLLVLVACVSAGMMLGRIRKNQALGVKTPEGGASGDASSESAAPPAKTAYAWWVGLSTMSSILLLSFTNFLTQDIAPIPMLWVLPLGLYLLTFILCFSEKAFYPRKLYVNLAPFLMVVTPLLGKLQLPLPYLLLWSLFILFCLCMVCHGEIYHRKPSPRHLPVFYLMVALGGALGGIFVNIFAPLIFDFYAERQMAMLLMAVICLYITVRDDLELVPISWVQAGYSLIVLFFMGILAFLPIIRNTDLYRERNFYGTLKVMDSKDTIQVAHGLIIHGSQYKDPEWKSTPTTYYTRDSAIGLTDTLLRTLRRNHPLNIGVIGLGAGTIATYGRPGDRMTFYEIDSKVQRIAEKYFSFLKDSPAKPVVVIGDARTSLEHEAPRQYDMLVVDAFNGDAIPVHLVTDEALKLYIRHIQPDGVILFHISNRFLNLAPVIGNLAKKEGLQAAVVATGDTRYVALTKDPALMTAILQLKPLEPKKPVKVLPETGNPSLGVWTDDYSNLFSVLELNKKRS